MAPEILKNIGYNQAVDWWSLGILVYELINGIFNFKGFTPFVEDNPMDIYSNILNN
jgi:hypothetical protein